MTKQEIIEAIAKEAEVTQKQAQKVFDTTQKVIIDGIKKGGKVRLSGFGTFELAYREARTGNNPRTGEAVEIPARKAVKFKPSADLKRLVN